MSIFFPRKRPNTKNNEGRNAFTQVEDTLAFKEIACCHCPDINVHLT